MTYQPSELKKLLYEIGAFPKKGLSQNFLIDGNIVRKIVKTAGVEKNNPVLEIGPGPGALTEALLEAGASVIAVEKDAKFAEALKRLQSPDNHLTIYQEDFLKFDLSTIPKNTKVVANLPYHITTPILSRLIPLYNTFTSITVMVQKEVASRMCAKAGEKEYGSLSLFLQFYCNITYGFTVEPTCFYPRPKVRSSVVKLTLKKPPDVSSEERFFLMMRTAFQMRRKMLLVSLKELYPEIETVIGEESKKRPEELSLDDFLRFFEKIEKGRP
jgi:16S rRNA (adenine1518-N6/adenine1519-N6)-dimethyltransferase